MLRKVRFDTVVDVTEIARISIVILYLEVALLSLLRNLHTDAFFVNMYYVSVSSLSWGERCCSCFAKIVCSFFWLGGGGEYVIASQGYILLFCLCYAICAVLQIPKFFFGERVCSCFALVFAQTKTEPVHFYLHNSAVQSVPVPT